MDRADNPPTMAIAPTAIFVSELDKAGFACAQVCTDFITPVNFS